MDTLCRPPADRFLQIEVGYTKSILAIIHRRYISNAMLTNENDCNATLGVYFAFKIFV